VPAIRGSANRFPLHTARRATMRGMVSMSSRSIRVRSHGATGPISSVEGSAAPAAALVCAPASLASKGSVVEAVRGAGTGAVDEWCVAEKRDVVEAKVPDGGVYHAVGAKGHHGADDGACEDVVPGSEVSGCWLCSYCGCAYQLWNSSMERAPPMRQAPRIGAYRAMIFHMAGW
jgi:hypothetical protein